MRGIIPGSASWPSAERQTADDDKGVFLAHSLYLLRVLVGAGGQLQGVPGDSGDGGGGIAGGGDVVCRLVMDVAVAMLYSVSQQGFVYSCMDKFGVPTSGRRRDKREEGCAGAGGQ